MLDPRHEDLCVLVPRTALPIPAPLEEREYRKLWYHNIEDILACEIVQEGDGYDD
jgi:hypothetical protein